MIHTSGIQQYHIAGPAAAEINFDSARSGAPAQNKEAVNPSQHLFQGRWAPLWAWRTDVWGGVSVTLSYP